MKKIFPLFISFFLCFLTAKSQYVNIPDENFRNFLQSVYPTCFNSTGQMDTSCKEIINEDTLIFHIYAVSNLDALKYFKRLRYLDCSGNGGAGIKHIQVPDSLIYLDISGMYNLIELPALPNSLEYLLCSYIHDLTSLPELPSNLKYFEGINNFGLTKITALPYKLSYFNCKGSDRIDSLPALPLTLDTLICSQCHLKTIPALPPGIRYLDCSRNPIKILPTLTSKIEYFDCSDFKMYMYDPFGDTTTIALPYLPPTLRYLNCQRSNIRELPAITSNVLDTLICGGNGFTSLPDLPASLITFDCYSNKLTALPVLPNTLRSFNCALNPLKNIQSIPDSVRSFFCYSNNLTSLPTLPPFLEILYCIDNQLTSIPALPRTLNTLECRNNQLLSLPDLPEKLQYLSCENNKLIYIPELPNTLNSLNCEWNHLTCLPKLPKSLYNLSIDKYQVKCIPNQPEFLSINIFDSTYIPLPTRTIPLCNPTNNTFHCEASPVISGRVFYDNNGNGIKDIGELNKSNITVKLSNGVQTYSNASGYFELSADTGKYSITVLTPDFYATSPGTYNYNFTNFDTLTYQLVPLRPIVTIDSILINITSLNWAARPGFSFAYLVSYENIGTTTLNPQVNLKYDNSILVYDSSNVPLLHSTNALTITQTDFVPGQHSSFIAHFTVKPTATLGDTLNAYASTIANTALASASVSTLLRGSFDPNDKQATPELTPAQVAAGKYITYTIRCQNTGTDTAFNIVIADTLSNLLQPETLEMLNSSHNCNVSVNGNIVYFEFFNILLPDSNRNESGSHGFVTFRIKPVSSATNGTVINNKAAIYFDYNTPVITNTAVTNIKTPDNPIPVKLLNFAAFEETDNIIVLYWNSTNEINTRYFVIEQSTDGNHFNAIITVPAKGQGNNSYMKSITKPDNHVIYYRLKIIDNDGQYSYSSIISMKAELKEGVAILTNPAKNVLNIKITGMVLNNTSARIINSQGIDVKRFVMKQGMQTIDISSLPAGTYYLQTNQGSKRIFIHK